MSKRRPRHNKADKPYVPLLLDVTCGDCGTTIVARSEAKHFPLIEGMTFKRLDTKARLRFAVCGDCNEGREQ